MTPRIGPPLGAASGIAYVVALMAAGSNRSDSTTAVAVELLAMLLFFPFLGYLWSVLRGAEGPGGWLAATVLATGAAAITIKMASAGPAVAARDGGVSPVLHDALQQVNDVSFIVSMLPLGACMAAVAAVVLRTHVLPAWLGWMAALARRAGVPALPPVDAAHGNRAAQARTGRPPVHPCRPGGGIDCGLVPRHGGSEGYFDERSRWRAPDLRSRVALRMDASPPSNEVPDSAEVGRPGLRFDRAYSTLHSRIGPRSARPYPKVPGSIPGGGIRKG
jgi:hypothetical protein